MSEPFDRAVVCLSGGMDSTSLLLRLLASGVNVLGISFNYGQKHVLELKFLNRNLQYLAESGWPVAHHTVSLESLAHLFHSALLDPGWTVPEGHYEQENMKETVVPNRNAIFASIAYGYAWSVARRDEQPTAVALGVHAGDHAIYPDCRPEFYRALAAAFELGNWDPQLVPWYLPYTGWDKADILRDARESGEKLELDFQRLFANTLTSYQPDAQGRASGVTGADVERILAFRELGLRDPVDYCRPWEEVVRQAEALHEQARRGGETGPGTK